MENYFDKFSELNLLQHKESMISMKIIKICLGKNPDNLNIEDLEKEQEKLKSQIAVLSVDLGLYKSIEEYYQQMDV